MLDSTIFSCHCSSGNAEKNQKETQLYHHPVSLGSQMVRLALEEKGIEYLSIRVNPLKGRNMDLDFFRMNPTAKLPVFKDAEHVLFDTISIIEYINNINKPLDGDGICHESEHEWMKKIGKWDSKLFTLSHVPKKYILFFSRFKRRVTIARMAEGPDLANSSYLAGEDFSMADAMFIPILARLEILDIADEYLSTRSCLSDYWNRMKTRKSFQGVIGKYFSSWRKYKTLYSTYIAVWMRSLLRQY
eukprot:TRINITY_DN2272_c0_g1_i3.p1 TRINITY_DN2272_c0_g1~~TRINITY_DN2272_c0_g1_i3.p1  ORF type:complete len:245 (-),score=27.24 TRINITY_DN2272_c0_g1_i3:192-926(-)